MTDTERAPIADETPSPLMSALLAQVAAQPRLKLMCIGCGAAAVALTACPACGCGRGYVAKPAASDDIGDPPPLGEDDPDRVETWTAYPAPPAPCDACGFFGGMCPECVGGES